MVTNTTATRGRPKPRPPVPATGERRRASEGQVRVVVGLATVSVGVLVSIALVNSSWMDVDSISVVGSERASNREIIEASMVAVGQPLIEVDFERARRGVEQVSWVGSADLHRSWNGEIVIAVTERGPAIALPASDGYAMIDHWGRQLELITSRPDGFVPISGIEASGVPGELAPPETASVLHLVQAMVPAVERHIAEIRIDGGEMSVVLSMGGRATFGDNSGLEHKIQALETILERVDLACLAEIDLSVPSAPTVRRGGEGGIETENPDGSLGDC